MFDVPGRETIHGVMAPVGNSLSKMMDISEKEKEKKGQGRNDKCCIINTKIHVRCP